MATPRISDNERKRRKQAIEDSYQDGFAPHGVNGGKGAAVSEAARRLGISRGTVQSWIYKEEILAGVKGAENFFPDRALYVEQIAELNPATPEQAPEERRELQALRDRCTRLEAALREADRASISEQDIREKILGLAAQTPDPPNWLIEGNRQQSGIAGVPSTIWSDWHLTERVSLAETNGVNEFSMAIAEARIRYLVEHIIDLCFNHMTSPRFPGIVVNLIGDIISGGIHPDLAENDEAEIFPAILWAVDRLIWALTQLADRFGAVFVACAPGNHGRVFDHRPRAKAYVYRNADWLIYSLLERHFQTVGDKRLRFAIPATGEVLYRVYHHRYMAIHGDDLGVKGGDGIIGVLGPIARGEVKMRHSSAQIGRDYDTLLMGHYHQTLWLPRAFVNNTLKGFDEYARRFLRAPPSEPNQSLWFTHPKNGVTSKWEVFLSERKMAMEANWVSWAELSSDS